MCRRGRASSDGRYLIAEVTPKGFGESVVFFDFETIVPIDPCEAAPAPLTSSQGGALPGGTLEFSLDGGQAPGVATALFFSPRSLARPSGFGVDLGCGEILVGPRIVHSELGALYQDAPVPITVGLPADPSGGAANLGLNADRELDHGLLARGVGRRARHERRAAGEEAARRGRADHRR